jgi:hypothetical protein
MSLLHDGAALRAHPVGPTRRVAPLCVQRVAGRAFERHANPSLPSLRGLHPFPLLPRGAVPDVLPVATLEQGHPVPHLVLLESDDGALHGTQSGTGAGSARMLGSLVRRTSSTRSDFRSSSRSFWRASSNASAMPAESAPISRASGRRRRMATVVVKSPSARSADASDRRSGPTTSADDGSNFSSN